MVYGLIMSDDGSEFYLYEHRNRFGNIKNESNSIWRHNIRMDGFSSISVNDTEGFIQTREITFNAHINLNYKTGVNGYLHIEFLNTNLDTISTIKNISGNQINNSINVPKIFHMKKGYLKIVMKECELYSIIF